MTIRLGNQVAGDKLDGWGGPVSATDGELRLESSELGGLAPNWTAMQSETSSSITANHFVDLSPPSACFTYYNVFGEPRSPRRRLGPHPAQPWGRGDGEANGASPVCRARTEVHVGGGISACSNSVETPADRATCHITIPK